MDAVVENLPEWDLSDLYASTEDPALEADFIWLESQSADFKSDYAGKITALDGAGLAEAIKRFEAMSEKSGKIGSYAGLLRAGNQTDPAIGKFYQSAMERLNAISTTTLFFTLELNQITDADLDTALQTGALAHFRPWLRRVRQFRPYELSEELETLLHEKSISGSQAFSRLFDETIAGLRFSVNGEILTEPQALNLLSDKDRAKREAAATEIASVFSKELPLFSLITNTLAKDKEIEDRWRGFQDPADSQHLANEVEPEVVNALVSAVQDSYGDTAHRYYALKAKWMGLEKLEYWDRNAPLPELDEPDFDWTGAQDTVLTAYQRFSPTLGGLVRKFFDNPWIDAGVRPGKDGGAFSHSTVPSVHPYILMNFQGKARDVMTLAHELGHGVHQLLAARQGPLMAGTPLTLAETASVFGEMLTFRSLLDQVDDPKQRKTLLAGKAEDMLNTVVRQIAFHSFEAQVHALRREAELTPDELSNIWMQVQKDSLGDAFVWREDYRAYWAYIPHFIHVPFYVYAYAFGDCLVNALYAAYEAAPDGFEDKYLEMLGAGGTLHHKALLAPFGLDASDPAFWKRGLAMLSGFIDELEAL